MRDNLTCEQVIDALQQRLDGHALSYDPDRSTHLDRCVECRERFAAAELLLAAYVPLPSAGLTDRVTLAVRSDRRQRTVRRVLAGAMGLAASVMIALQFGTNRVEPEPPPFMETRIADAKSTVRDWTQLTANALPSGGWTPTIALGGDFGTALAPFSTAGKGVANGLEPVTGSAKRAFDRFRRDLPLSEDEE